MSKKNSITTADNFTYEEYTRFLECLHNDKLYNWEAFCRLAFCTGCRGGDVLDLCWVDVIGKKSLTIVEQKTKKVRQVPFNPSVRKSLEKLWELSGKPNKAYPIMQNPEGKPLTIQTVNRKLKEFKYRYRLDIGNFSTHTFRKTFGRYVYDTNGHSAESLLLLNRIFKHANIQTTQAYIGITKGEIDNIYNSIKF